MPINTANLVDYAWSDIAKAAKTAMISAALGGGELIINGRTIQRISIQDAQTLYALATEMVDAEAAGAAGGGNLLVQFGDAQ